MDTLKFTLSGRTAFFRRPDVNVKTLFSFGQIHKVTLMGIFGSMLGLKGYNQQGDNTYPEFYEKLNGIKVAIKPNSATGVFQTLIHGYNNATGHASKEKSGILQIHEQWLENVSWDIYLLIQSDIEKELAEKILNYKTKYQYYLGQSEHFATIANPEILEAHPNTKSEIVMGSLFPENSYEIPDSIPLVIWDERNPMLNLFRYSEYLPVSLDEQYNFYEYTRLCYTNEIVELVDNTNVYQCSDKTIYFF